jgi:hypothetical protein
VSDVTKKHPHAGYVLAKPQDIREREPFPITIIEDDGSRTVGTGRFLRDGESILPGHMMAMPDETGRLRRVEGLPRSGPAQVATQAYRSGWERTFSN